MPRRSSEPALAGPTKSSRVLGRLDVICRALGRWVVQHAEIARQRRALARLDDRLLRDVGLTRDEAASEVRRNL